ncbi:MAG TPA: tetratricopeptide repeat protein [Candidatus Polarisedimenticolia bacterium]|nr:tetratricopeptide repeat protein [Candidatus Polarisedimenticolia bacterium]
MARDPLSRAFLQLAEEYRKAGRFEEAVQVCNEGLARHPGYHTARIALGRTYLDAGDLENAHQALIEVLDSMPENHLAAKLLAEVQLRLGNRGGAVETYRAILSHYPGDREVEGLLNELGEGGGGSATSSETPSALHDAFPGVTAPYGADTAAAPPDRLEVVDGGEPPSHWPAVDSSAQAATNAEAEPGTGGNAPQTAVRTTTPHAPGGQQGASTRGSKVLRTPPPPPAIDVAAPAWPAGGDALQTNTLAELYLRQGLVERAIEVYRAMLRVDPENEQARRRLQELGDRGEAEVAEARSASPRTVLTRPASIERREAAASAAPTAHIEVDSPGLAGQGGSVSGEPLGPPASPADASWDEPVPVDSRSAIPRPAAAIDRLERWLVTIRGNSTPAGGGAGR